MKSGIALGFPKGICGVHAKKIQEDSVLDDERGGYHKVAPDPHFGGRAFLLEKKYHPGHQSKIKDASCLCPDSLSPFL